MWLREHKLFGAIAIGFVVIAGAVILCKREPKLRLVDGTEYTVRRAESGTNSYWINGAVWKRLISNLAPAAKIPPAWRTRTLSMADTNEVLFVWVESRFKGTNFGTVPPVATVVEPSSGLESAPAGPQFWVPTGQDTILVAYKLANFPRVSSHLLLRFYDRARKRAWEPMGELLMRNPKPETSAGDSLGNLRYGAKSLPDTRANGVQSFTLTSFTTGVERRHDTNAATPTWTAFGFKADRMNPTAIVWRVRSIQCSDAFGNIVAAQNPRDGLAFEGSVAGISDFFCVIDGHLWTNDAWTVRVAFEPSGALAEDRVTFAGLEVPPRGTTNSLTNAIHFLGSTIRLLSIATPPIDALAETNLLLQTRKRVTVTVKFDPAAWTDELRFVSAIDSQGRNIYRLGSLSRSPHEFRLLVLKEATALDLEVGIRRLRHVEFRAIPIVLTNSLPPESR